MEGYLDIADLPEDERIKIIGEQVIKHRKIVAFFTDDEPGKPERYIQKLKERYSLRLYAKTKGPIKGVVLIKVGPGDAAQN